MTPDQWTGLALLAVVITAAVVCTLADRQAKRRAEAFDIGYRHGFEQGKRSAGFEANVKAFDSRGRTR